MVHQNSLGGQSQLFQEHQNLHILIVRFFSILITTIHSSQYSSIVFWNFWSYEKYQSSDLSVPEGRLLCIQPVWRYLGAPWRISMVIQSCWVIQLWLPNYFTFCWCRRLDLEESRSPIQFTEWYLHPVCHWFWTYLYTFDLKLIVMLRQSMVMVMVIIMVILLKALSQVDWLYQWAMSMSNSKL